MRRDRFLIAQLSDLHCGSASFAPELLTAAVDEIVAMQPDLVVVGGDVTAEGDANEFRAAASLLSAVHPADRGEVADENAGGLVEGVLVSRWDHDTDVERALQSRDVAESLVRVRQLLRLEPVIRNYVTTGNGA